MIDVIQSHSKSIFAALALIVFAFCMTACNVSDIPKRIQTRVENMQGDASIVIKTPGGVHMVAVKNGRQEDGFFVCDRLDISGRFFEFHATSYRRPLIDAQ